jgi:GNAT superfamily N-acetyltransferase
MTPRPFEERDYPRLVAIRNAAYPDHLTNEDELRHQDASWEDDRYFRLRLMLEDGAGQVVGVGELRHMPEQFHPDKYALFVAVDPPHRRRGHGSTLYATLTETLGERGALLVRSDAQESHPEGLTFLLRRGFHEVQRAWESRLDVGAFDPAPFAGAEARVSAAGITFTTLAEERRREGDGVLRAVYELDRDVSRDMPAVDPITDTSYEHFLKGVIDSPNVLPDAWFIARAGDTYAGVSSLWKSLELPDVLYQGITGVRREYRRRGIALALKLLGLRYARERGVREIRTWNNTINRAMLSINEAMGFRKQPVWIELEKSLRPPGAAGNPRVTPFSRLPLA